MYQMLTGSLPYDTPAPADLARLARGELITAPRLKNPKIPKAINDIVLRALAPEPSARYQRAADVLTDILAFRDTPVRPVRRARAVGVATADDHVSEIQSRLKARQTPQGRFCWHCRKPLQARTSKCPFCNETQ
jgi:serine/threonine protein kinase